MTMLKTLTIVLFASLLEAAPLNVYVPCFNDQEKTHGDKECCCHFRTTTELVADCSHRYLRQTPNLRTDIKVLNLNGNCFSHVGNRTFENYTQLEELHLASNAISAIETDAFVGLSNLKLLNLYNNSLPLNKSFPPGVFRPLLRLTTMFLNRNINLSVISGLEYPSDSLSVLPSLNELHIDGLPHKTFSTQLGALSSLYMKDGTKTGDGFCSIGNITEGFFDNISNLQTLELRNCSITDINKSSFLGTTHLIKLDLSDNYQLEFKGATNALFGLQHHNSLRELYLNAIHEPVGIGTELPLDFVQLLHNTSVRTLGIENNRIEFIAEGALTNYTPKSLQHLQMSRNRMMDGPYIEEIRYLSELKTIDLSYQLTSWNKRYTRLGNGQSIQHILKNPHSVNRLTNQRQVIKLPPSLENISLYQSNIRGAIHTMHFDPNNSLRNLTLHGNVLCDWSGPVFGLNRLTILDLSNNLCDVISVNFFSHLSSLKHLDLQGNLLYGIVNDSSGHILGELKDLRYLNLSYNRLRALPADVFQHLTKLEVLDLTYNTLTTWIVNVTKHRNLRELTLDHNLIRMLNKTARDEFDKLAALSNFTLSLNGNQFDCACYCLDFIEWLSSTNVRLAHFGNYTCLFDDLQTPAFYNKTYFEQNVLKKLTSLCKNKNGYLPYVIAGSSLLTVIAVAISCVVTYRSRWKLRYMYLLYRARYRGYSSLDDDESFEFDAFVSYADEDRMFVTRDMVEKLEEESGLKLCIHHREFIPGLPIEENIASGIHKSRHVIVLLTKHFIASHWCMYEFNIARMEDLCNSRDKLLIIIDYKPVPNNLLPDVVKGVRELNTYTVYPQGNVDDSSFWRNLIAATKL